MHPSTDQIRQHLHFESFFRDRLQKFRVKGHQAIALCPFHEDKSPSFSVNLELGVYNCFGCGEKGDSFSFLMKLEGMDFKTSLGELARLAGIEQRQYSWTPQDNKDEIEEELQSFLSWLNELRAKYIEKFRGAHEAELELDDKARELLAAGPEVHALTLVPLILADRDLAIRDTEIFRNFLDYLDDPKNRRRLYLIWKAGRPHE